MKNISWLAAFSAFSPLLSMAADLPVIDVHTHTSVPSEGEYLKQLKSIGAVGAVSHGSGNMRDLSPALKKLPVIQCYGVQEEVQLAEIEKELKSRRARCVKIYLGYVYRFAYDEAYRPVYKLAEKYDVPVVFHTGDTSTAKAKLKYTDPLTIDEVAVDFPKTTFVIAHLGNPWIDSAMEVTYKNPNVYVEASALVIGDISSNQESLDTFMIQPIRKSFNYIEDPSKFMFGTDWPLVNMKDYFDAYKKAIPEKHWCKVFFGNAVKVFRLKELEGKHACP